MKKLLFFFFLICCAMPLTAGAADLFNTGGSFKVAIAVKLGRGNAYSVSTSSNVNTGGQISAKKSCSTGCSDCDTTTGNCNACSGSYYNAGGKCVACSTIPVSNGTCTYCMGDESYVSCEGAKCNTGYWDEYGTCKRCDYSIDNCAQCDSTGSSCTKCNDGYTLADNGKSCLNSAVTVNRYHRYNGSKIFDSSTTISRSNISSYYDSWPDVDIYDEDGGSVTQTTESIAMVCSSGVGEFWTMSACQQYKSAGYYCAESGYSCPFEARLCMIDHCMDCDPEGLCATCESGYTVGSSGSNYGKCIAEGTATCSAGYYLSNGSCVACAEGTYSKGGTATSCSSCTTLYTSLGSNTCTSCTTAGVCLGSNSGSSGSNTGSGSSTSCSSGQTYGTHSYGCNSSLKYTGCAYSDFGKSCTSSSQCLSGRCASCALEGVVNPQGSSCR